MVNAFKGIIIGVLIFILVLALSTTMITGTDATSTLMVVMLPMVVGFGVLIYAIVSLFKAGKGD
jgi:hypothetical protein